MNAAFEIQAQPIDALALSRRLANPRSGALATFEGWVRNHHEGRDVEALEYEAFVPLALREGEVVLGEARARFDIERVSCVHRIGALAVGDIAVWVGASAAHRAAAFDACRYVIDEIKLRLPIWKKEYFADGSAEWVNCAGCAAATR